jgi:hypothetical protein
MTMADLANYTKKSINTTAKAIFGSKDPGNDDIYDFDFFTNKDMYDVLKKQLLKIDKVCSVRQFAL